MPVYKAPVSTTPQVLRSFTFETELIFSNLLADVRAQIVERPRENEKRGGQWPAPRSRPDSGSDSGLMICIFMLSQNLLLFLIKLSLNFIKIDTISFVAFIQQRTHFDQQ